MSDIYEGGGAKPQDWHEIGTRCEGEIIQIRTKQLTRFGTEQLETWPDGSAKMTPIVTVQLDGAAFEESESDDGRRDIYLRSNAYTAFGKALREAFKSKPEDADLIGCTLILQFYKTESTGKGQPRKLFRARIKPRVQSAAGDSWDQPTGGSKAAPAAPAAGSRNGAPAARPAASSGPPPGHPAAVDDDIPF